MHSIIFDRNEATLFRFCDGFLMPLKTALISRVPLRFPSRTKQPVALNIRKDPTGMSDFVAIQVEPGRIR